MVHCDHQFGLILARPDGEAVGEAAVEPDWEPAREWTRFDAIRRGRLPPGAPPGRASVEPIWHEEVGEPYARGFRVSLSVDGCEVASDFPVAYFHALAQASSAQLVARGKLADGDLFRYVVTAIARDTEPAEAERRFTTQEIAVPLPLSDTPLSVIEGAHGLIPETAGDMPVVIPASVLTETRAMARAASETETGGVLVGYLHHDRDAGQIFAEVTAQIPARHTVPDAASLTFTSQTWSDVRGVLALRDRGELMLGWWHSHLVAKLCSRECAPEKRRGCQLSRGFFSPRDRLLHRTMFVRSYGIGLLVSVVAPGEETFAMFGWRAGLLEPRGFAVCGLEAEGEPLPRGDWHTAPEAACSESSPAQQGGA